MSEQEKYVIKIEREAALNVPLYCDHKRSSNWLAKISLDPRAPGGLRRQFFDRARGHYYYLIPPGSVKPGDALEFGADYFSGRGRRYPHRWYGVVTRVTDTTIELVACPSARAACEMAEVARSMRAHRLAMLA